MPAGALTIYDRSAKAFELAPNVLAGDVLARHRAGATAFAAIPSVGLGPTFNHTSCVGCHVGAGRGLAAISADAPVSSMLVRVSLAASEPGAAPVPVPVLGLQIQDHAVPGVAIEARVVLAWDEVAGAYGDGQSYALRRPRSSITRPDGSQLGPEVLTSLRMAPPAFGVGLLAAIPAARIEAGADPDDRDGDGIRGHANHVWDPRARQKVLGRFGWKANTASLAGQVAAAYANDMGIANRDAANPDGTIELADATLDATTFFVTTLGAPEPWPGDDAVARAQVASGEAAFRAFGCAACHLATWTTDADTAVGEIVGVQTIHPYSDLLVHDLGDGLADGRPDFEASGREWRTTPLWGLGLTQVVLPGASYLHDGRARDVAEAILWHGGEAEAAREAFRLAPADVRAALLAFLASR